MYSQLTVHFKCCLILFQLLKQLEPLDTQLKDEISDILSRLSKGEDVNFGGTKEPTVLDKKTFIR